MHQVQPTDLDEGEQENNFSQYFEFKSVLGNGSFGLVVAAVEKKSGEHLAVKVSSKVHRGKTSYVSLQREAHILSRLNHKNVITFKKLIETDTRYLLAMEWLKGGQLRQLMKDMTKEGRSLTEEEASTIIKAIVEGIVYIHANDTIHRDLKPENILFANKKDLSSVKLIDFGLAVQYDLKQELTTSFSETCGTKIFMAPEMLNKVEYGKPVDIWSLGIMMYQLLNNGKHPYYDPSVDNVDSYLKKVMTVQIAPLSHRSELAQHLLSVLLQLEPSKRYTAVDILSHPWITRNINSKLPMTLVEKLDVYNHQRTLIRIIKAVMVTKLLQKEQNQSEFSKFLAEYSAKIRSKASARQSQLENWKKQSASIFEEQANAKRHPSPDTTSLILHSEPSILNQNRPTSRQNFDSDISQTLSTNLNEEFEENHPIRLINFRMSFQPKGSDPSATQRRSASPKDSRIIVKNGFTPSLDNQESIRKNRVTNVTAIICLAAANNLSQRIPTRNPSISNIFSDDGSKGIAPEQKKEESPQRVRSKSHDVKPNSLTPVKQKTKHSDASPAKSKHSSESSFENSTAFRITTNKFNNSPAKSRKSSESSFESPIFLKSTSNQLNQSDSNSSIKPLILAKPVPQTHVKGAQPHKGSESASPLKKSASSKKASVILVEGGNSKKNKLSVVTKALIGTNEPRKMSDSNSSKEPDSGSNSRKMSDQNNTYSSDGISSISTIEEPKKTVIVIQKLNSVVATSQMTGVTKGVSQNKRSLSPALPKVKQSKA